MNCITANTSPVIERSSALKTKMMLVVASSLPLQKVICGIQGLKILDPLTPAAKQELPTCCHGELLSDERCQGQEQEVCKQEVDVFPVVNLQCVFLQMSQSTLQGNVTSHRFV